MTLSNGTEVELDDNQYMSVGGKDFDGKGAIKNMDLRSSEEKVSSKEKVKKVAKLNKDLIAYSKKTRDPKLGFFAKQFQFTFIVRRNVRKFC